MRGLPRSRLKIEEERFRKAGVHESTAILPRALPFRDSGSLEGGKFFPCRHGRSGQGAVFGNLPRKCGLQHRKAGTLPGALDPPGAGNEEGFMILLSCPLRGEYGFSSP